MDNMPILEKPVSRRKVAKAVENSTISKDGLWRAFKEVPCLVQRKTGMFYLRKRINGEVYRRSLETEVFSVARERMPAKLEEILAEIATPAKSSAPTAVAGTAVPVPVTVEDGILKHTSRLGANPYKKQSRRYHATCQKRLLSIWPGLSALLISGVTEEMCLAWATKERGEVSANYFNNMLSFLRQVFAAAIAVHKERTGVLISNPAMGIKRTPKRRRPTLDLPDKILFEKILETIRQRGSRQAEDCIDLIEFLAYSGARVYSEAAWVKWQDIDWGSMELTLRGDPDNGLKWRQPGETRAVGINQSLEKVLRRMESKQPNRKPTDIIFKVTSCDGQLEWACKKLKIPQLTHHKLRHWFGTRCAELGVGPEVIGELLGHRDRGVTALKEYVEPSKKHVMKVAIGLALN